ncbi:oxygen-independent coproporphyrinogen III oxidase [Salibaculum griseiflavum]|uniref:Coproporphyrinogen-III oxidase n=1 Tax=Salibaculum griseiflavum TaxID=1914409 RepID=A0A2V1P7W7_9RHOB|nr:oxygen-independent coproporphyrinogen III oxidase [Salibaculum griseiflavum]PWG18426.1 oxygen-independent coproporphyrinogen III oxidase [Salibaculum griseiflavum]
MSSIERLRRLGLFDARAPRYTSYPPANHFGENVGPNTVAHWLQAVPSGARVSLYLHIPYCRRLCWFCACRTQGTSTDRPLIPYLDQLRAEMAIVDANLPKDVVLSHVHLGGGTPTLLPPEMIRDLGRDIAAFRPWAEDCEFSVEIDPTEVDKPRIEALQEIGMNRASIGVQDFDPSVQECIGRIQSFEQTRDVVEMLRDSGVNSLNMDILYGLPHQDKGRMADSVQKVLSLAPDRVALYGYAHVPWMAKRQVMIPSDALPNAEERLHLFDTARRLFVWDGYREIGIDHYAREGDSMAEADRSNTLRRNFQGYTVDDSDLLIGLGASAISRYPQGFAQNHSTSSRYATAIAEGRPATVRGHAMSPEDLLRSDMIEMLMCRFELDLDELSARHGIPVVELRERVLHIPRDFPDHVEERGNRIRLTENARLVARLVAAELDQYAMPEGRHSRAL